MRITRKFLGFAKPALHAAAECLCVRFTEADMVRLDRAIVVLPGGRAARRLLELLLERAEAQRRILVPPQLVTVGQLPEQLYENKKPFASDLTQHLVWAESLRAFPREQARKVIRTLPREGEKDSLSADQWLEFGTLLAAQHRALAGDCLSFANVVTCGQNFMAPVEVERWTILEAIRASYLQRLDKLNLWDKQTARLFAIDHPEECKTEREIVLVGTADMDRTLRRMLDLVAAKVTTLVFAPEEWASRFDAHGCIIPSAWTELPRVVPLAQVRIADGPADQARAVLDTLAGYNGRYRGDQISVGVPDEALVPQLARQFHAAGVPCRYGPGSPVGQTGPWRVLEAVASYLERGRFTDFAALVRQADVESWLSSKLGDSGWLIKLDRYFGEHLPSRLDGRWLGPADDSRSLAQVYKHVEQLLAPLTGQERPLNEWTDLALALLTTVYEGELNRNVPADRAQLEACEALRKALLEHSGVPEVVAPRVSAATALRHALATAAQERVAAPADSTAVELLGWLELPLDDAPALVVTSFNEGLVPATVNSDLFLPNALRSALGVVDNARRYARDAYATSALLASRAELTLVVGKRDAKGDPLIPSRLLLVAPASELAERVLTLFGPATGASTEKRAAAVKTRPRDAAFMVPDLAPFARPIDSLSVTDFRAYLNCPYRFFLERVLRLEAIDDRVDELDPAGFGNILHAVLKRFGEDVALRESDDAAAIESALNTLLNAVVAEQFGAHALTTVRVQVEQMRLRLAAFARLQAERTAAGWRIAQVECAAPEGKAVLNVDGQPLALRGRIDRIDVHEPTGRWAILDYKSSEAGDGPEATHRDKKGNWLDLQLPLYRHFARALGHKGELELGYILLPKSVQKVGFEMADWSEADLKAADAAACTIAAQIRAWQFSPVENVNPEWDAFAAICQNGVFQPRYAWQEAKA